MRKWNGDNSRSRGMKAPQLTYFVVVVVVVVASFLSTTSQGGGDSKTAVYSACSDLKFSPSSPYRHNLDSLLSSLSTAAAYSLYSNFTTSMSSSLYPVSGLYQCNGDASLSDCESCVRSAVAQIPSVCSDSASATIRLRGCLLRYGNESFVGKPDKSLQFKRCVPGAYDPNLMKARDELLSALVAEKGSYRVRKGDGVDGVAQCVGDQDVKQCKDCLEEAVSDLKDLCSGAASAEVHLGKCYVGYSSRGVHYYYNKGNGPPSQGNGHSNAGKDLAIIIGVSAAVVLIILFINYLRKSAEEKGGITGRIPFIT